MSAAELIAESDSDVAWLVDRLLPAVGITVLAGDPKSFKSLLALQLALAVGGGDDVPLFLDRRCGSGPILFVEEEGSRHKLRERILKMAPGLGLSSDPRITFAVHQGVRLDEPANLARIDRVVEAVGPALIVLDPLVMLHSGDENKASDMGQLMRGLVRIAHRLGTAILLVHHVNKPNAERRTTRMAQRLRGSSAFAGATDANLILDRDGDHTARLRAEFRDAEPVDIHLELDPSTLLLRPVASPQPAKKIPSWDLVDFVKERGQVTVLEVARRFGVVKNTARTNLECEARLDVRRDPRLGDRYFVAGGQ